MSMTDLQKIENLKLYVEQDAFCPCCEKHDVCAKDCTFELDCTNEYDRMVHARKLLNKTK